MTPKILLVLLMPVVLAQAIAVVRFHRKANGLITRLGINQVAQASSHFKSEPPDMVRRFAERATNNEPAPSRVRVHQRCEIRSSPDEPWKALRAEQVIAVRTPGLVWDARQKMGGITMARVVDAFVDGRGLLEVRLLGSVPILKLTGPEIDQGELLRYLAELPIAPDAIIHNPHLQWQQIGDDEVEVGMGNARVRFFFENGDIARCEADERPRLEGKISVKRPWQGRFWDYREVGGRRIPTRMEVSWVLEEGPFVYFRGEILELLVAP